MSNLYSADFGASNTDKSLEVNSNLGITTGALTIATRFKAHSDIASGNWVFAQLSVGATAYRSYYIRYDYNAGTRRIVLLAERHGVAADFVLYPITLGATNWHSLVLRFDGTTLRGNIDGVATGTIAVVGNGLAAYSNTHFSIGCYKAPNTLARSLYASGLLDDTSVWDVDKGNTWANEFHTSPAELVGNEANLRAYYKFDADLISDETANNYDLTNLNSVTQNADVPYGGVTTSPMYAYAQQ